MKVVKKTKRHILCLVTVFENRAADDIMWKNIPEPQRPQMTMTHAHCMPGS